VFLGWLVNSVFHSVVVVVVIAFIHFDGVGDASGKNQGLWYLPPSPLARHLKNQQVLRWPAFLKNKSKSIRVAPP
jgi:hypothetical protein